MPSFPRRSLARSAIEPESLWNLCWRRAVLMPASRRRRRCASVHQAAAGMLPTSRWMLHSRTVSAAGFLNTTKCDSEKFTMKLTPVASTFPNNTGMKWDATRMVVVFAAKPAS